MNAAARTVSHGNIFRGDFSAVLKGDLKFLSILIWLAVIASSLAVIYVRHIERNQISELEHITRQNAQLELQSAQLLLEKSMWASPARIRRIAKNKMNMEIARPKAVIAIR